MVRNNICYIASAGAGKTTKLVKDAAINATNDSCKKIAIITYTQNNQAHIRSKLEQYEFGYKIVVMGWFEFLLKHWITPFKTMIFPHLIDSHIGIAPVEGKSGIKKLSDGRTFVAYQKEDYSKKYLTTEGSKVYTDKISELAYELYTRNETDVIERLNSIFDFLYFDECQDFVGYDYEILKILLVKSKICCVLAGDPRQHTYSTHATSKYKKFSGDIATFIQENINRKRKQYVIIDKTSLVKSHRCPPSICNFANVIMSQFPKMESANMRYYQTEHCKLVRQKDAENYINRFNPIALIWNHSAKDKVHSNISRIYNMGEVKGLDFLNIIVYPTKTMEKWIKDTNTELSREARAKLYVAVTRAEISTGIVVPDDFHIPLNSKIQFWDNNSGI
ncbi:MAG: AAA family ATPase [Fermentimonas sp.]|nr:AAA family ATPase [Fermentimonas sp.]